MTVRATTLLAAALLALGCAGEPDAGEADAGETAADAGAAATGEAEADAEGSAAPADSGTFTARVTGAHEEEFSGPATFAADSADLAISMVAGEDGPVIRFRGPSGGAPTEGSFDVQPLRSRTEVSDYFHATYVSGGEDQGMYRVTEGTLEITSAEPSRLEGRFDVQASSPFQGGEVSLTGRFEAVCLALTGQVTDCF